MIGLAQEVLVVQTISIMTDAPERVIPLLTVALEREKRILKTSVKTATDRIADLSARLSVDVDKLMSGQVEHSEVNDMDLIELEGEVEILRHLERELSELEMTAICR